jgi:hypothetical protein
VAELEADRRVLLAQLNLQATGSKAGLSGILARYLGFAIPAKHVDILYLYLYRPHLRRTV